MLCCIASYCLFSMYVFAQPTDRVAEMKGIDTTAKSLQQFASEIAGNGDGYKKATTIFNWLSQQFRWTATDYKNRTVNQILARGGGNCFELAKVYMAMIKELNIQYRPIAEINIHPYSDRRQNDASVLVEQKGLRYSVFGREHNDHRWVEIYDSSSDQWQPADPASGLLGLEQWMKGRVWFGERKTIDTSITNKMIVPIAVFVTGPSNTYPEDRSEFYLVTSFNKIYNGKLSNLPSWNKWVSAIREINSLCREAFEGKVNLHLSSGKITALNEIYASLNKEYLALGQ